MAIFHLHAQVLSRSDTRSCVAAAAYRHRAQMTVSNAMDHQQFDYSMKREDLVHEELALPDNTPIWFRNLIDGQSVAGASEALWNAVETHERRANGQLAREMVFALPQELSVEDNIELVRNYVSDAFTSRGMVADWVYHAKPGNAHVHVMLTMAPLTKEGFGSKWEPILDRHGNPVRRGGKIRYRAWAGDKSTLNVWRKLWSETANRHLQLRGHDTRIDHRSYEAQGIELHPTTKIGVGAKNIVRKGQERGHQSDLDRVADHRANCADNVRRILRRPNIVLDAITREKSIFDVLDIARYLHRYVDDPAEFQSLMLKVLNAPELVMVQAEGIEVESGEPLPAKYSTREMTRLEADLARRAKHLASVALHDVPASGRQAVLSRFPQLSDEQRIAIERITNDERLGIVVGRAGAGKTTMMNAARAVWETGGYHVVGGALAGKAAEGLEKEANIPSRTLAAWVLSWGQARDLPDERTVFVMDEAGMVDSRLMADIVETVARSGGKLVLIGDPDQLQPIAAGAAFRSLSERVGYAELGTIYRQREQWMREASMNLARGEIEDAIQAYRDHDRIVGCKLKDEAVDRLIADWSNDYDPARSMLILAHLRRDVRRLNNLARAKLIGRGLIDKGFVFQTEDGERHFATGEQLVFLKNDRNLGVKNGMIGRIVEAGEGRFIAEIEGASLQTCRRIVVDQRHYRNVDHGYATTVHKSQGATVDNVKVLATLSLDRHLTYVALTRHREDLKVYHGTLSFEKNGGLIANLSKRGGKETTLDYDGRDAYLQALRFANNRGLYGLRVAKAMIENQRRWILQQKSRLLALGKRLATVAETLMPFSSTNTKIVQAKSMQSQKNITPSVPWFDGIKAWPISLNEAVATELLKDRSLVLQWEAISRRAAYVFQKPDEAMTIMRLEPLIKRGGVEWRAEQQHLAHALKTNPHRFGPLKGHDGLLAGAFAKSERRRALMNAEGLARDIERYAMQRAEIGKGRQVQLQHERACLHIEIPALSPAAHHVLVGLRRAINDNNLDVDGALALATGSVGREFANVARALEKRFGGQAFLASKFPDAKTFETAAARVTASDRYRLADAWPSFHTIQRIAAMKRSKAMNAARKTRRAQINQHGMTR